MDTVVENVLTAVATPTDRRQLLMGDMGKGTEWEERMGKERGTGVGA
jgi:hypothetical protein